MTQPDTTPSAAARRRGPSITTLSSALLVGAAACCILAVGSGLWIGRAFAQQRLGDERKATATAVANSVVTALQPLLASNDLSAARRIVSSLAGMPGVEHATLLLPDGRIVADSNPKLIQIATLPRTWAGPIDPDKFGVSTDNAAFLLETVDIAHRGRLFLKIATRDDTATLGLAEYTGIGLTAVVALLLTLLARRRLQKQLACLSRVSEAVHELATSDEPLDQLRLCGTLGPEADAWNRAIDHFIALERSFKADTMRSALNGNGNNARRDGEAVTTSNSDLHATIDLLPTGVVVVDKTGSIRTVNGAAASLLKFDRKTIVGVEAGTIIVGDAFAAALRASQIGGERRTFEIDRTAEHGGILRINVRPLRREDQGGSLVTLEDVTQQRIADASRNQFVAQATHELRAPLTNMRLCLEAALEDDASNLEAITGHLNVLNDETRRLERLVSEMLSVAEIEAGSLTLKADDVKIDRLLEELRADHSGACAEKSLELAFELPPKFPQLRGDRDKLSAALHNLLNNAIKYTPSGGRITVAARQDGDRLIIDVSDTGFGIPADDQARVFERFFRARDPRVAKITGTGLGLALSRDVARLHGGDLSFKSELDRGTTFTLQLPVALQPA